MNFLLRTLGHLDRFVDVNKMFGNVMAGDFAGGFCLHDDELEVPPLCVSEQMLNVAGEPVFDACFSLLGVGLKVSSEAVDEVGVHASRSSVMFSAIFASSPRASALSSGESGAGMTAI